LDTCILFRYESIMEPICSIHAGIEITGIETGLNNVPSRRWRRLANSTRTTIRHARLVSNQSKSTCQLVVAINHRDCDILIAGAL
jgi:hypothetical protein